MQNSAKQWFWGRNDRYNCQNSNFWIQSLDLKPFCVLLAPNITYMQHLRSMGAGEASTDKKMYKNSEKQPECKTVVLAPKLVVTAQNLNFWLQTLNFRPLFVSTITRGVLGVHEALGKVVVYLQCELKVKGFSAVFNVFRPPRTSERPNLQVLPRGLNERENVLCVFRVFCGCAEP